MATLNQFYLKCCTRVCMHVEKYAPDASSDRTQGNKFRRGARKAAEKQVFQHALTASPDGAGWTCWVCARSFCLKGNLLRQRCLANCHVASHSLWIVGRITFCSKCGARHSQRVRLLKGVCNRALTSQNTSRKLRLMKEGRDISLPGSPFAGWPSPDFTLMAKLWDGLPTAVSSSPQLGAPSNAVSELIFQAPPVVNVYHAHVDDEAKAACLWEFCTD